MCSKDDYIALVKQARQGDEESLSQLSELARKRLHGYIYRLTLAEDVTQDIVQESILEMLKFLNKLQRADRFWPSLFRIAGNNLNDHQKKERLRKSVSASKTTASESDDRREGLENLVGEELKQVISASMTSLKARHRRVLALRCYEEMSYCEISDVMQCSEFAARRLFWRAKKALGKQLHRRGLAKWPVSVALVVFGKMTASSEAAAANVSVSAATMKVGAAASLIAMATSKTAVVALAGGALIAAGSVAVGPSVVKSYNGHSPAPADRAVIVSEEPADTDTTKESWYFFPEGPAGPVMMRTTESSDGRKDPRFRILQNQHGNYRFDGGAIYKENHRPYNADLSVRRLPTDDTALSAFITQIEGSPSNMEYISASGAGLLVICKRDSASDKIWRVDRRSSVLDEVFFESHWFEGTRIIDNRDAMHRRGWTYFEVSGEINGEQIEGAGRIPFTYEMSKKHYPWADIRIGRRLRIVDSGQAVHLYDATGKTVGSYAAGSFFDCLGSPWMGLHTIDAVRRAAAKAKMPFETRRIAKNRVQIAITERKAALVFEIDLARDVVETIKIPAAATDESDATAIIRFDYKEEIPPTDTEFRPPRPKTLTISPRGRLGVTWPLRLLEGHG
ncbi:MAG: RNA polymerase sigma factor [Planctomycetota bacterium]